MKSKLQTNKKGRAGVLSMRSAVCLFTALAAVVVIALAWWSRAYAAEIPAGYALDASTTILNLAVNHSYEGITRNGDKEFGIAGAQGFVTLARVSQSHSLEGYTFKISARDTWELTVDAGDLEKSFYGIGNDEHPFKGKIYMAEVTGSTYLKISGWNVLFNNLSNEASITKENDKIDLWADFNAPFALCDTLTITKDSHALDISGFRFAAREVQSDGSVKGVVQGNKTAGLVAGKVTGSGTCAVDLSPCFKDGAQYALETASGSAGGLFGVIEEGVGVSVTTGNLNILVSSAGAGNVGLLVGENKGSFTVSGAATYTGSATAADDSAAGLIGVNANTGTVNFANSVTVNAFTATGAYAGGVAGKSDGEITVAAGKTCTVSDSTFTSAATLPMLGGAVGQATAAPAGSFALSGNTFAKSGNIGGFIGSFTAEKAANFTDVTVTDATFNGTGAADHSVGGYFGLISGKNAVTLTNDKASTFTLDSLTAGSYGGVIGTVAAGSDVTVGGGMTVTNTFASSGLSGSLGGAVGCVKQGAYCKLDSLTLNNTMNAALQAGVGDLVGQAADKALLDVGRITYRNKGQASVLVSATGVGTVLRLAGAITDSSASSGHIVRTQNQSLLYADTDYIFTRAGTLASNDVGNYGQILRNDKLHILAFDAASHTVSVTAPLDSASKITLNSAADAAKLALTLHTHGAVSGVSTNNYKNLLSAAITLTGDIDLQGSGVEQFTPSNELDVFFTGKIFGGRHTLTLSIGESARVNESESANVGLLKDISSVNIRSFLGAFASMNGATVDQLTVAGDIKLHADVKKGFFFGGLAAYSKNGTVTISDCTTKVKLTLSKGSVGASLYAGGFIGNVFGKTFSITGSTLAANIIQESNYSYDGIYLGGAVGKATPGAKVTFTGNTVSTIIDKKVNTQNARIGGCFGELACSSYVDVDMTGTKAEKASITSVSTNAKGSAGGLIGHTVQKCKLVLDGAWRGAVSSGNASMGGLIYDLDGKLTVNSGFSVNGSTFTSNNATKGILVAEGTQAFVVVNCAPSGFDNVTADNGFDLFVGKNIASRASMGVAATGGLVSVETGANIGQIPEKSGWYSMISARKNSNTRYYFNIARLDKAVTNYTPSTVAASPANVIYWHVYDYVQGALPDYVRGESFPTAITDITGADKAIDMTNYSFYPTKKEGVTFDFSGHKLTFGYKVAGLPRTGQMFGIQSGILSDVIATNESITASLTNITLAGTVYPVNGSSGAFICGKVMGNRTATVTADANFKVEKVFFEGLTVDGAATPLLIDTIGSNVTGALTSVSQYTSESYEQVSKQNNYTDGTPAASALIGRGGVAKENNSTASSNISVTFKNIVFAAEEGNSIFTKASYFEAINCVNGTGAYIYNFNLAEDWDGGHKNAVTYGTEISTNPKQYEYYDQEILVDPTSAGNTQKPNTAFSTGYMPYVLTTMDGGTSLRVNRKSVNFDIGWGTYEHPYIIERAAQLEELTKLVSMSGSYLFQPEWIINYPKASGTALDYTDCDVYTASASGTLTSGTKKTLEAETLREYLRGAYYKISAPMELSSEFTGIGTEQYPFHGVIVGSGTVITMPDNTNVGNTGYCGFINVANGCAVYGLELSYKNVGLSGSFSSWDSPTSRAFSTKRAATSVAHFGGAIGWIVGGDNVLDHVTVRVNSLAAGHKTSVFGGYVGLISGGGVSLRGLGEAPADMADYGGYYYYNPYVGKVISGYAMSGDRAYDNTAKNFSIPVITSDRLTQGCMTEWEGTGFKITVADTDDLLMLGFAMSGGALEYVSNYLGYGQGALSRHGDYHAVGEKNPAAVSITKGRYEDDLSGGGKSLFLSYFGINSPSDMRKTEFSLELTAAEYDLSKYPNAFRGLGSPFGSTNCYNIQKVTGLKNGQGRAGTVIKLYTDIKQYYKAQNAYEPDAFKNLALVEERNNSNNTITFSDIKLTGKMALGFVDLSGNEVTEKASDAAFCVGGYVGYARNAYFYTAEIENLTVRSPGWAAGFAASEEYDQKAQDIPYVVNNCHVTGLDAKGVLSTGGLFAYLRVQADNAAKFNDVYVGDSIIQVINTSGGSFNSSNNKNNSICAGSIVGASLYDGTITMSKITVNKTAVLSTSSKKMNRVTNYDAGGFIGNAGSPLRFEDCLLDSCVVFSGTALRDGTAPADYDAGTTGKVDIRSAVYEKIKNAVSYAVSSSFNKVDADGNAGGFAGTAFRKITIENCAIRSNADSTVILGYNNSGGVVGEGKSGTSYSFTGLNIQATDSPLYIIGRSRSAGLIPWHVKNDSDKSVVAKGVSVSGKDAAPVYIITTCTGIDSSDDNLFASGLLGNVNQISVDVSDAVLSNCIIAGKMAAGVLRSFDGASTSLQNIKVFNNYIQSTDSSLAGIFSTVGKPVSLDGLYFADNMLRSGNKSQINAGGIVDTISDKGVLNGCNILMKDNDMAFTGSAKSIADILKMETTKPSDVTGTDYERVGLIGYENKGTANILALSVEEDDNVAKQKRFRSESSSSSSTVIFAGYGAPSVFETEYFGKKNTAYTPAQALADHGVTPVTTTDKLNGDAVTTTQGSATPDYLNAYLEGWAAWKDKSVKLTDTGIKTLSTLTADKLSITQNRDLSVLSINGATQQTMSSFLNLLTGGGFGAMGSAYTLTVQADRYALGGDGTLSPQAKGDGSVLYDGQKFTAGKYDDLESDNKSLTVLTLTFRSSAVPTQTYSMNVVVYYPQILEYKSYISALEGEVYQLSSFLTAPKNSIDVSAGNKYSLYVEYAYNDTAKKIENFNFDKRIDSGTPDGSSGGTKNAFTVGTKFVLVDLNSPGAYGYKSYYYTADKDTYTLDFSSFRSEAGEPFTVKLLPKVVENLLVNKDHLCKDANYGHVERYLLMVIPQTAEELMQYTLRATVAENDRNIIVRDHKEKCSVNVWGKATGEMKLETPATTFSNVVGKELVVNAHVQVDFPRHYISAMHDRDIYGTHVFKIMDASNKAVSLPAGTKALLTGKDGKTLLATRVTTPTSTVRYELDNIVPLAPGDRLTDDFVLTLDFSEVSPADFSGVFADGVAYKLQDEFYISSDRAHYTNGSKIEGHTVSFTAKTAVPVKLTVIPVDRKSQAINMGGVKDSTDSGKILFNLVADFSAVPVTDRENIKSAQVEFFLYQKQYDADSGKHVYSENDLLGTLGTVDADGKTVLPLTDWKATGQYTLSVNLDYVLAQMKTDYQGILSNYRLMAKVTGLDANGTPVAYSAESYFVFLLCDIDNQIGA